MRSVERTSCSYVAVVSVAAAEVIAWMRKLVIHTHAHAQAASQRAYAYIRKRRCELDSRRAGAHYLTAALHTRRSIDRLRPSGRRHRKSRRNKIPFAEVHPHIPTAVHRVHSLMNTQSVLSAQRRVDGAAVDILLSVRTRRRVGNVDDDPSDQRAAKAHVCTAMLTC